MSLKDDLIVVRDRLDVARYDLRATDVDAAFTYVGEAARLLGLSIDSLPDDPPVPVPPAPPAVQFVAPIPPGAVYGKTKWLAGSLGCDLFCRRGTVVVAPADCVVEEVIGGQGISGGAELILRLKADASWAWRWRHVQAMAGIAVGTQVRQGQTVAVVNDTSLDQLGSPPAWSQPMPDRYQHLDLSVDKGTDQFSPQGGGGGNVSAYAWITSLGYQGRVLSRTPGPPDAGMEMAEAIAFMGRRP